MQVLHVGIALGDGGMVEQHEQKPAEDLNRKRAQGKGAQVPGDAKTQPRLAHSGGKYLLE